MGLIIQDLKEELEIVFNEELNRRKEKETSYYYDPLTGPKTVPSWAAIPLISGDPQNYRLKFPTMESLRKIYAAIQFDSGLKKDFLFLLKYRIQSEDTIFYYGLNYDLSDLALATLFSLNEINEGIDTLYVRALKGFWVYGCLKFINEFLRHNHHLINKEQLKKLRATILDQSLTHKFQVEPVLFYEVKRQIDRLLYMDLNRRYDGINFEINQDKEKVIEKIEYYKFGKDIVNALIEIDKFLFSEEKTVSSGMNNNLRNVMATMITRISDKIREVTKEEIPKNNPNKPDKKEMGLRRDYIKKHLKLTEEDDDFVDAFVDVLHEEGGHSFMSEKEYFRLSRNITITFLYFLLSKLDKFLSGEIR